MATSSLILVAAGAIMAGWWLLSRHSATTSYAVSSPVSRVEIVVDSGNVQVLGGGPLEVGVQRDERYAYDQVPEERRSFDAGVLHIESDCPPIIVGNCSAHYRLTVPDNVPVDVRGGSGTVSLTSYRGAADVETDEGDVIVDAFCGFRLRARTRLGDLRVGTACPPERLELRSAAGDVTAMVPSGRYQIDAESALGTVRIRGVEDVDDAPWQVSALSSSGNVTIDGGR